MACGSVSLELGKTHPQDRRSALGEHQAGLPVVTCHEKKLNRTATGGHFFVERGGERAWANARTSGAIAGSPSGNHRRGRVRFRVTSTIHTRQGRGGVRATRMAAWQYGSRSVPASHSRRTTRGRRLSGGFSCPGAKSGGDSR